MSYRYRFIDSYLKQDGTSLGNIFSTPIYIDSSDENNIYLGYGRVSEDLTKDNELLIRRISTINNVTTLYHAYGEWANRTTLQYI